MSSESLKKSAVDLDSDFEVINEEQTAEDIMAEFEDIEKGVAPKVDSSTSSIESENPIKMNQSGFFDLGTPSAKEATDLISELVAEFEKGITPTSDPNNAEEMEQSGFVIIPNTAAPSINDLVNSFECIPGNSPEEDGFTPVARPSSLNAPEIIATAKTVWKAKSSLVALSSTAMFAFSSPAIFAFTTMFVGSCAAFEYAASGKFDNSKVLIGATMSIAGLGVGASIIQKVVASGIAAVGVFAFGPAAFSTATYSGYALSCVTAFMLSTPCLFLMAAGGVAVAVYLGSEQGKAAIADAIESMTRKTIADAIANNTQGILSTSDEECGVVRRFFAPAVKRVEKIVADSVATMVADIVKSKLESVSACSIDAVLQYFRSNAELLINMPETSRNCYDAARSYYNEFTRTSVAPEGTVLTV